MKLGKNKFIDPTGNNSNKSSYRSSKNKSKKIKFNLDL